MSCRGDAGFAAEDNRVTHFQRFPRRAPAQTSHAISTARHSVCTTAGRLSETQRRALIADGDLSTRLLLSHHLDLDGFSIHVCTEGREALDRVNESSFELIVVDAALYGLDGVALCRAIRLGDVNPGAAIFVVAASTAESDKVAAFTNGADDYIIKPVAIREFLARVSAVMRRASRPSDRQLPPIVERPNLRVDPSRRRVIVRGQDVGCSRQEFEVLYALASSPGVVFSREELLARHWTSGGLKDVRLVDPIVSRLRRKIEHAPDKPKWILTVWGVGYKFADPENIAEV